MNHTSKPAAQPRSAGRRKRGDVSAVAIALLASFGFAVAGCATAKDAGRDTAIGAGAGGAAGAGLGYLVGGKKGALIGLGVGALAGGSVGLYLDHQRKELERIAEVKKTENGLLVQMKNDILFDTGSESLKSEGVVELNKMGDILAKYADDRVKIDGHTDSVGDAKHNQALSERRASAVKTILVSRGVQEKQIEVRGYGESKPVADNGSAEGRAKNRRVELHIDVPNPS
jgi:outer membrane protein OmpA-like peptidoglycan-associated protein